MKNHDHELLAILIISIVALWFGARGIARKGRDLRSKTSRQVDLVFSIGQLGCGLIGIVFLLLWYLKK